jgi:hypothetical protein
MWIDRRSCFPSTLCALLASGIGLVGPAHAQGADARGAARAHFERGVAFVNAGELEDAAAAFELAHRTSPHYSVLYNLGQAYATLGRSVDAVRAFEAFLRDGGARIPAERRARVKELIELHRGRTGELRFEIEPAGAAVFVDGLRVGSAPIQPFLVTRGRHAILVESPGFLPKALSFEVAPGKLVSLKLALEPEHATASSSALLGVDCETPGVTVSIDGRSRGQTPFVGPLLVASGSRSVGFTRDGYRRRERSVEVPPGSVTSVACALVPDPSFVAADGAVLDVRSAPRAPVYVDGEPYRGERLPPGVHVVRLERSGYRPWTKTISLEPRLRRLLIVELEPTPERRAELESARRSRSFLAAGIGAASLAALGGAAALYAWNGGRYDDWNDSGAPADPERAASIERVDNLSFGLGFVGVAGLTAAGVLWLTGGD